PGDGESVVVVDAGEPLPGDHRLRVAARDDGGEAIVMREEDAQWFVGAAADHHARVACRYVVFAITRPWPPRPPRGSPAPPPRSPGGPRLRARAPRRPRTRSAASPPGSPRSAAPLGGRRPRGTALPGRPRRR